MTTERLGVLLHLNRSADTDAEEPQPAAVPQDGTPEVPAAAVVALSGGQMTVRDQACAAVAHAWRVARRRSKDLAEREGGLVHGLMEGKPPSVGEQCRYAQSRAWVPPGHDGGIAENAGVAYHVVIGRPGVAFGNWVSATAARPFRFAVTALILGVIILIALLWL